MLIKHGAEIDKNHTAFCVRPGDTVQEESDLLDLAIINGQISTVKLLLKNGAQVNQCCLKKLSEVDIPQKTQIVALLQENIKEQIFAVICDYLKHLCPEVEIRVKKQEIDLTNQYTGKKLSKDVLIASLDKVTAKKFTKVYDLLTEVHKNGQLGTAIFSDEETKNLLEEYRGNFIVKFFIDILYYLGNYFYSGSYGPKTYGGKFFQQLKSHDFLFNSLNHDSEQKQITSFIHC